MGPFSRDCGYSSYFTRPSPNSRQKESGCARLSVSNMYHTSRVQQWLPVPTKRSHRAKQSGAKTQAQEGGVQGTSRAQSMFWNVKGAKAIEASRVKRKDSNSEVCHFGAKWRMQHVCKNCSKECFALYIHALRTQGLFYAWYEEVLHLRPI